MVVRPLSGDVKGNVLLNYDPHDPLIIVGQQHSSNIKRQHRPLGSFRWLHHTYYGPAWGRGAAYAWGS